MSNLNVAGIWSAGTSVSLFCLLWIVFRILNRGSGTVYFDPQDFAHFENGGGRELPLAAKTSTFEPLLKSYIDAIKLLITVSAASIAFGASSPSKTGVYAAKIVLAFSILYGVVFSSLLQFFYDEYTQNLRAYTAFRYTTIQALGFASLLCFVCGYLVWAFSLR